MPEGTKFRMAHEGCSIGPALQVSVTREGIFAYCHLCKESMFVKGAALSLAEKQANLAAQETIDKGLERSKAMPLPKVENPSEWPLDARIWLYEAGIRNLDIAQCGIYYHLGSNRVVIPIVDNGNATGFWQARSVSGKPKYLNPAGFNRDYIVAGFNARNGTNHPGFTVLCEDWKSAFRVNRATGVQTIALLGTNLSDPITARLLESGNHVAVWLDDDRAGKSACSAILRKMQTFGIEASAIHTPLDPKAYSDEEIEEILKCHLTPTC